MTKAESEKYFASSQSAPSWPQAARMEIKSFEF
jgi:hypothetical protein